MGLFDLFKPKNQKESQKRNNTVTSSSINRAITDSPDCYADSSSISPDEKPYYQPDTYYTYYSYAGSGMGTKVVPFDDRKETSYPSARGLYVGEIMLLDYCNKGNYPKPKSGYPGFWWFKYGIRDIGHALESLEKRGFLQWAPKTGSLKYMRVNELKQILSDAGLPTSGKKADLIERIILEISEDDITIPDYDAKYELTELGKAELKDNEYVPYMHNHRHLTTEDGRFGDTFTVWDINKLFPDGNTSDWRKKVGKIEKKRFGVDMANANPDTLQKTDNEDSISEKRDMMRAYINSKQDVIKKGIKSPGDGYDEESKGIDYRSVGKDKEALVQFYISIGKRFDAPALYHEAAIILRKYGMYEEELEVIKAGMRNVPESNWRRGELEKRINKVEELIHKNK